MDAVLPADTALAAIARIDSVPIILDMVCRSTGMGFAAVAHVTERQWVACAVKDTIGFGLTPGGELELSTTICNEIRDHRQTVAFDNADIDRVYCSHPTPQKYGFKSYISAPILLPDGQFFGTLCAIDPRPLAVSNPTTIGMFNLFADLIAQHLDAQERMIATESALRGEREMSRLREQFIAVLGHDLRNPLSAISGGIELLRRVPALQGTSATGLVTMIGRSATRMAGVINNILDFTRGRLGGGFVLDRKPESNLAAALQQVVEELRIAHPTRALHCTLSIDAPVYCDAARVAQLLSNLISNALTHGDPASPVWVNAQCDPTDEACELSVTNRGDTIPPQVAANLFEPFVRGEAKPRGEGLGLGLFIASEIARAHDGTLAVRSVDGETCFTFRMPHHRRG